MKMELDSIYTQLQINSDYRLLNDTHQLHSTFYCTSLSDVHIKKKTISIIFVRNSKSLSFISDLKKINYLWAYGHGRESEHFIDKRLNLLL